MTEELVQALSPYPKRKNKKEDIMRILIAPDSFKESYLQKRSP